MTAGTDDATGGPFCAEAWAQVGALVDAIVDHPFNRALASGDLPLGTFRFYLVQDSWFLEGFARASAAAAVLAPEAAAAAMWASAANEVLVEERQLHERWLTDERWRTGEGGLDARGHDDVSPTCLAYASWLQAVALGGSYAVLTAALLPCYWVYEHVGRLVLSRGLGVEGNPFRSWLDTYASEEFSSVASAARAAAERAAAGATAATRRQMLDAFRRATEYEWLFWDSAWRLEAWPTARWLDRSTP